MIMKKIFTLIMMLAATLGMQAQDTWTVAGQKALLGVDWDPTAVENDMTSRDGITYMLVKTGIMLAANENGYGFKVVQNHDWNQANYPAENYMLPITEDGEYTVTFTFDATTTEVSANAQKTGEYVAPSTDDQIFTIAGVPELCGTEWNAADETNDMSSTDGINFTLVKEGIVLEGGRGYGFKVVVDHSWDENYGAADGGNYMLTVAENGTYTVTFKFNKETKEVGADAVKTGDAVIADKIWTIAGSEAVLGTNWDNTDTNNDMTDAGDGTFILVKKHVSLLADTEYEFKVLANHSWSENYGADGVADGPNITFSVDEDGIYDVTFTFNPEDKSCWADAEPSSTEEIKGDANGDGVVDVADVDFVIEAIGGEYAKAADVNGDGAVDVADVDFIIEQIQ